MLAVAAQVLLGLAAEPCPSRAVCERLTWDARALAASGRHFGVDLSLLPVLSWAGVVAWRPWRMRLARSS